MIDHGIGLTRATSYEVKPFERKVFRRWLPRTRRDRVQILLDRGPWRGINKKQGKGITIVVIVRYVW